MMRLSPFAVWLQTINRQPQCLSNAARHCEERSDEASIFPVLRRGLLRGACHRAALCADPLARNDELAIVELVEVAHRLHDRLEIRASIERVEQLRGVRQ